MSIFSKMRLFQKAAVAIGLFYFGLMILVAFFAHARQSGSTGMDMMKIHMKLHGKTPAEENKMGRVEMQAETRTELEVVETSR